MNALVMGLKGQINLAWIALGFLTRLPIPANVDFSQTHLNRASRYFPLVGWLIGLITALSFWLMSLLFPSTVAILLSMLVGLLSTGCFHEDGMADSCDGLGGSFERVGKLNIMKDSRIGTYGSVSLWMTLSLKFALLNSLEHVALALLIAHPLSRASSTALITLLPYVSDNNSAKVKPLAETQQIRDRVVSLTTGALALLLAPSVAWILVVVLAISLWMMREFLRRQIGGFTGDTLGANQQVSELLIYAVLLASGVNL